MTFQKNWDWQINFVEEVRDILKSQSMNIVKIEIATPEEDMKQCTDMKIKITAGDIAVRIRRENCKYRDLTIRAYNQGYETEIDKLRKGFGDWYLYAWVKDNSINEWVLVDINKLRDNGCFSGSRPIQMNKDKKTGFIKFSIKELIYYNALIATNIAGALAFRSRT